MKGVYSDELRNELFELICRITKYKKMDFMIFDYKSRIYKNLWKNISTGFCDK